MRSDGGPERSRKSRAFGVGDTSSFPAAATRSAAKPFSIVEKSIRASHRGPGDPFDSPCLPSSSTTNSRHPLLGWSTLAILQSDSLVRRAATMMQTRAPRCAFRAISHARSFHSSATIAARSPSSVVDSTSPTEPSKRSQSTAAAATTQPRPAPAPTFNQEAARPNGFRQANAVAQQMDHSFMGMNGGQIFHEMMLRQGVKHVCKSHRSLALLRASN